VKRVALTRRTWLRSSKPLARRTRLQPVNRVRLAKRRKLQFAEQSALARTLPCCSCGAPPPSDPSHLKTRGAGGLDDCVVAQCRACHIALGNEGAFSFWQKRGLDPAVILTRMRALVALMNNSGSQDSRRE
jgi:hypothetical protein